MGSFEVDVVPRRIWHARACIGETPVQHRLGALRIATVIGCVGEDDGALCFMVEGPKAHGFWWWGSAPVYPLPRIESAPG